MTEKQLKTKTEKGLPQNGRFCNSPTDAECLCLYNCVKFCNNVVVADLEYTCQK